METEKGFKQCASRITLLENEDRQFQVLLKVMTQKQEQWSEQKWEQELPRNV